MPRTDLKVTGWEDQVQCLVCITHSENVSSPFLIPFFSFPGRSVVKNPPANARATGSIPGPGRLSGGGNGNRSNILAWKILCVIAKSQIRKSTQAQHGTSQLQALFMGPFQLVKSQVHNQTQDNKLPRGHNEPGNPLKEMYSFYKYLLSSYYVSFLLKYHLQCIISVNPPNNPVLFYCFIIIPI